MDFKTFIHLVYIRGFFDSQESFTRGLLEHSVENSSMIVVSESALKGYIRGDPYYALSEMMINAGMDKDLIAHFFESLYETRHFDSPTFNNRFHGQSYKEALYVNLNEKGEKHFPDFTHDEMSQVLANCLYDIFHDNYNAVNSNRTEQQATRQLSDEEMHSVAVDRYSIDEKEKAAIINSCGLVLQTLKDIKRMTDSIDKKQRELKDSSSAELWKEHLRYELNDLTSRLENRYSALSDLCSDLVALLEPTTHLHKSMAKLSETAHKLIEDSAKFIITSEDGFRYNALVLALSDFESHFNRLKRDWNTV